MADVPVYLSPKRKRGRPRKNANLFKDNNFKSLVNPHIRKNLNAYKDDGMVGRTVYGVIEGSFDAGFFISVRTSNNCTPFRGVIFQSDKVVPVTPANDLAPDAKMYQRSQIPSVAYTLPSQFNGICPISPCSPQISVAPYALTRHSAFSATEPTLSKVSSCYNVGGNITTHGDLRLVNYQSSSACQTENLGIMEHNDSMFGLNMNNKVNTGDMVSESSFESMFDNFISNGMESNLPVQDKVYGSALEPHCNIAPQSQFETQQYATIVNQRGWEKEPQVISSELDLTDVYHSEPNNLDLNFNQNLFSYQHEIEEQPKYPVSNFDQQAFIESVSTSSNLKLNLALNKQERYSLQEHEPSNARVETKSLVPFLQSPEHETMNVLNSLLETCERFCDKDGTSLVEVGSPGLGLKEELLFTLEPFSVQSITERCVNQNSSSIDSITDMDYVLSEVVSFVEPRFWEAKFT